MSDYLRGYEGVMKVAGLEKTAATPTEYAILSTLPGAIYGGTKEQGIGGTVGGAIGAPVGMMSGLATAFSLLDRYPKLPHNPMVMSAAGLGGLLGAHTGSSLLSRKQPEQLEEP